MSIDRCPACGHTHEGPGLAGICVGCPCPVRPEQPRGLTGDQVGYLRRILAALSSEHDAPDLTGDQRGAYRHALTMLDELLAEAETVEA